ERTVLSHRDARRRHPTASSGRRRRRAPKGVAAEAESIQRPGLAAERRVRAVGQVEEERDRLAMLQELTLRPGRREEPVDLVILQRWIGLRTERKLLERPQPARIRKLPDVRRSVKITERSGGERSDVDRV